jgi:hypothetical protein
MARFFQGITAWHLTRPPIDQPAGTRAARPAAASAASTAGS